jgi:drug/metabolite transporter (DMT)-like permease
MPLRARLALIGACILWAVSFVATKVALAVVPPLLVVTLRLVISAACFAPWLLAPGGARGIAGWRGVLQLVWLSLLGTGLHYGLQTVGLQYTTASHASLYAVTAPITILFVSAFMLGERITARKAMGVALAVVGVLLVMGPRQLVALQLGAHIKGDLLVLASIVMWGLFTVFGKPLTAELGAIKATAWVTVIGALWTLPAGWHEQQALDFSLASITLEAWGALAFLGVGCSFLATLLYFVALQQTESQKVGVYLYTIPPLTAVVALLYLGEIPTLYLVSGAALVLAGVALTERG